MKNRPFNRAEAMSCFVAGDKAALLEYNLSRANLSRANLSRANLSRANLSRANLSGADLDFASWTLSCLTLHIGKVCARLARQIAFHFCSLPCDDPEFIAARNALLPFANKFHRCDLDVRKLKPISAPESTASSINEHEEGNRHV